MEILEMAKRTKVYELELENNTFAGDVLMIRMRWSVFPGYEDSMGRVIVSTLDITREMKENQLKSTIMQIAQEASRVETLQELYRSIHWALAKIMPADNLYIALYDEEKGMVSFPYFVDQFDEAPEPRIFSNGWTEHVIRTGKPVLVSPDYVTTFEEENGLDTVGQESIDWLGVPLIVKDRTIGAIVVQTYEEGSRYTQEHADWLIIASTQIAMAIDRKQAEEALKYSSTHDKLTGLYNRAYFEAELIRLSAGRQNPVGVIMLDVDGLKNTNDTYGHGAGDELLRRTANVLLKAFRVNDLVARIGGDEFVILLPQSDLSIVQKAVERIEKALSENNTKRNRAKLSLSIGICCTGDGININDAIKIADQEMYAIKSQRKQNTPK
jgi:diguanylate cyclase (GGDEF)-like protein